MKVILLCVIFIHYLQQSTACECIGENTVKREIKGVSIVVVGKVIDKTTFKITDSTLGPSSIFYSYLNRYKIAVSVIYKGKIRSDTIEVVTGLGNGDCGFKFEIGQEYIIYANYADHYFAKGIKVGKYLKTDICKRTCKLKLNEIKEIEKNRKPR